MTTTENTATPRLSATDQVVRWVSWLLLIMGTLASARLNGLHAERVGDSVLFHVAVPLVALLAGLYAELILMSGYPRTVRWTAGLIVIVGFASATALSFVSVLAVMKDDMAHAPYWGQVVAAAFPDAIMIIAVSVLVAHRWLTTKAQGTETEHGVLGEVGGTLLRKLSAKERAAELAAETERVRLEAEAAERAAVRAAELERVRLTTEADARAAERAAELELEKARIAAETEARAAERAAETERARLAAEAERAALNSANAPARTAPRATPRPTNAPSRATDATAHALPDAPLEYRARAEALVSARATTADPRAVAHALLMSDQGASRAEVTRATGIQKDALRRLLTADAERRQDTDTAA